MYVVVFVLAPLMVVSFFTIHWLENKFKQTGKQLYKKLSVFIQVSYYVFAIFAVSITIFRY